MMDEWYKQQKWAEKEKGKYKKGDKIKLVNIDDSVYCQYEGQIATVNSVDDMGQISASTTDGHTVNICAFYGDVYYKIEN